ncbi:RWD domain-containing protein 1 [Heterodontus francisci]|uniref:RWD domain-containing protein 1 n=1 Tax=Heterodontus francisci TaxID=7792 RepID=UPI00355B3F8B
MTDYTEEQRNELEALESIYPDSFTVVLENPASFTITVASDTGENEETVEATIQFTYVEQYPDDPPIFEIIGQENLQKSDVADIVTLLNEQVSGLKIAGYFKLVQISNKVKIRSQVNSWSGQTRERMDSAGLGLGWMWFCRALVGFLFFADPSRPLGRSPGLMAVFHGTTVTIENFLSWKARFDTDLAEIRRKRQKEEEQAGKVKLTGKQLFETDHNLDTSDIQFLEEGNNVEVDESLFQDMDDLELDDDDDPDYNPDLESDED